MNNLILACAFTILLIGLGVFYWARQSRDGFNVTNLIAWLLMALFPVLLLFSIFPDPGKVELKIFGTSATGAIALFIFIWTYGNRAATKAVSLDDLKAKNQQLEARVKELAARPGVESKPVVLSKTEKFFYQVKSQRRRKLVLITGNLENVKGVAAWVSSENTNMQMARFYDRSVSGTVRYLGAKRDALGRVTDDIVAKELKALMDGATSVEPGTVVVTGSGELRRTHGVEKIFHVASVNGQAGYGYRPVENIGQCVIRVLERACSNEFAELNFRSILFPLLGAGTARAELDKTTEKLLTAAIQHLETATDGGIEEVYFLTWTDVELDACRSFLTASDRVAAVSGVGG